MRAAHVRIRTKSTFPLLRVARGTTRDDLSFDKKMDTRAVMHSMMLSVSLNETL